MLLENMAMALHAIRANKMRSFLTMLGIIIGIGSVIAIVSVGDTMRKMFSDQYKDVGMSLGYVAVSWYVDDFRQSDMFTLDEMRRIEEVFEDEIAYIDSYASVGQEVSYEKNKAKFDFTGIDYHFTDVKPMDFRYGRALNESDVKGRKPSVVMEDVGAEKLFGTANAVGKSFRMSLNGEMLDFNVVGIYHKEKTPLEAVMGMGSSRESAYIPYTLLTRPNDYFQILQVYAREDIDVSDFFKRLTAYVAKLKGRTPEEIMLQTALDQMGMVDSMMGGMSAAVGGIAAISLLVGGIGIMNIMLVSVTERTREIGIRKALGATTGDVLIQFLTESAFLSACGGIIGIALGAGLVSLGGAALGAAVVLKPSVVLLAVGFSAAVGVFFGLYPASKAAKKDPIDALRYE